MSEKGKREIRGGSAGDKKKSKGTKKKEEKK